MGNKREVSKNKSSESTFISDLISNYAKIGNVSDAAIKNFQRKPYYLQDMSLKNRVGKLDG